MQKEKTIKLKKNLVILLSFFLLLPSFGSIIIYTTFKINQDKIATTICIQRKVANNSCQGHCALKKSLKKLDENERKMDSVLKGKTELVYIKPVFENTIALSNDSYSTKSIIYHITEKPISKTTSTFRPPAFFI